MKIINQLYETLIRITNNLSLISQKLIKLRVIKDCFDEKYLQELFKHYRNTLKEKKLKENTIVEVLGCWKNFYGSYIKCKHNNEVYNINPKNLFYDKNFQ